MTDQLLYHYTSPEALRGILATQVLYMTSFQCLEDRFELVHGLFTQIDLFEEWAKGESDEKRRSFYISLAEKIVSEARAVAKVQDLLPEVFVASFCATVENSHLWEKYGKQGKGVALAFSGKIIPEHSPPNCRHVTYKRAEFESNLKRVVDGLFSSILAGAKVAGTRSETDHSGGGLRAPRFRTRTNAPLRSPDFIWINQARNYRAAV